MNNNLNRMKVFITRDCMWGDFFSVRIGSRKNESSPWAIAEELKFRMREPKEEGTEVHPCFNLSRDDAQTFMDELWNVGIRPTEGTGSAGSLAATQRHLDDMRHLVFKTKPTA